MPTKERRARNPEKVRATSHAYYLKNRAKVIEHNQKHQSENRKFVREYKLQHPCHCGFADPRALVFHHRDPKEKDFTIGSKIGISKKKLETEISKCDVLCANCHMILHSVV